MKRNIPKMVWIFLALVISSSLYLAVRYGLRPKPIPILNPTEFDDPQQIGAVVYRGLRQSLRQERIILLSSPIEQATISADVWSGFVKMALADQMKIDVVFQDRDLMSPQWPQGTDVVLFQGYTEASAQEEWLSRLKTRLQRGHVVLVYGTTDQITHFNKAGLAKRIEALVKQPTMSLALLPFAVNEDELSALQLPCPQVGGAQTGAEHLACATLKVSRKFFKKRLSAQRWLATMERHGLKEYYAFVHKPKQ